MSASVASRDSNGLRAAVPILPRGILTLDRFGMVLLAEGGVFETLGINPSVLVGRNLSAFTSLRWIAEVAAQTASQGTKRFAQEVSQSGKILELRTQPIRGAGEET